jgi:AcrR family transcriptional regulator
MSVVQERQERTPSSTQVRLLDAAERLIGERGVDAVSLRAINAEAGGNVAAAHYHFGSKEELVRATLARRMTALTETRLAMLAPLEKDRAPSLSALVEVMTIPLIELAADDEGVAFLRFMASVHRGGDHWRPLVEESARTLRERLEPVVARVMRDIPAAVRDVRWLAANTALLHILADPEHYSNRLTRKQHWSETIGIYTSILMGQPSA